jgi:hypothetical protein
VPAPSGNGISPETAIASTAPQVTHGLAPRLAEPWIGVLLFLNELAAHAVLGVGVHLFLVSVRWGGNALSGTHRIMLWDAFPADWLLDGADFVVIIVVFTLAIRSSALAYLEWRQREKTS